MKVLLYNKFQVYFVLVLILCSCNPPEKATPKSEIKEKVEDSLSKPLKVILGQEYHDKLFVVTNPVSKKVGLYNSKEEEILPTIYDEIYSSFVNPHYVAVVESRKEGLFDLSGKRICESIYNGFLISPSDSSIIGAYLGSQEKWKIFNVQGTPIFSETYTKIQFLPNGLVILQKEDYKSSLASITGEFITPFEFDLLLELKEDKRTEKWYVDNDIIATAVDGMRTVFVNSKGVVVDK